MISDISLIYSTFPAISTRIVSEFPMENRAVVGQSCLSLVQDIHPFWNKLRKSSIHQQIKTNDEYFVIDTCTYCEKNIYPSMGFCKNDHRYCKQCLENVKKCIICTKKVNNTRKFSRVFINFNLYYPCWNVYRGCTIVGNRQSIEEHEKLCLYGFVNCPFVDYCKWSGADKDLFLHLQQKHSIYNISNDKFDVFFYHKSKFSYFRLTAYVDRSRKGLRFYITYIGPERKAKRYWYTLKVWHLTDAQNYFRFFGFCKSLSTNMLFNNCHQYETAIPFEAVPNYCSEGKMKIDVHVDKIPKNCVI